MNLDFLPQYSILPVHNKYDGMLAALVATFILTQSLWFRFLPISDKIPESFWNVVPQESSSNGASEETETKTRNIQQVFSERNLDLVVFWGSQSGRAEMLARRLAKSLSDRFGLNVYAADLDDYDHHHLANLQKHQLCAFVLSTYGDGDPPDNTEGLWNTLQKFQSGKVNLENLHYAIFGLGNSNYRLFNRVAEHVDTLLQSRGATRYGEAGKGDDANGDTENAFSAWRRACEDVLKEQPGLKEQDLVYRPSFSVTENSIAGDVSIHNGQPCPAVSSQHQEVRPMSVSNIYKLWDDGERLCIHADLDLGEDRLIKYKTGDHLALWPSNANHEVERLLRALGLVERQNTPISMEPIDGNGGGKVPVPTPTTFHSLFRYYLEICAPLSMDTLTELATFAPSSSARSKLEHLGNNTDAFQTKVLTTHATLADVLLGVSNESQWDIPTSFLLERLKSMKPRYYSISSSTVVQPRVVSITAVTSRTPDNVYNQETGSRGCYGLATGYLHAVERSINGGSEPVANLQPEYALAGPNLILEGGKVFGQIRRSTFKLPVKTSAPIIMLGAGTGVAPFRAFVQERARIKELGQPVGEMLLFMGFRSSQSDYIYETDWVKWRETLGSDVFKFWTAFSRETKHEKAYIQDRLRENAQQVMDLLDGNSRCHVYVCGSSTMARDVVRTLTTLKMAYSDVNEQQATSWIKRLRQSKQLLEDVWG